MGVFSSRHHIAANLRGDALLFPPEAQRNIGLLRSAAERASGRTRERERAGVPGGRLVRVRFDNFREEKTPKLRIITERLAHDNKAVGGDQISAATFFSFYCGRFPQLRQVKGHSEQQKLPVEAANLFLFAGKTCRRVTLESNVVVVLL